MERVDKLDRRRIQKILKSKKVKQSETISDYLRSIGARVKEEITIIAAERGFEILIHIACLYGAGQIVRIMVSKDFKVSQLLEVLKQFYSEHKEIILEIVKQTSKVMLHAGMMLKDVVVAGLELGIAHLKIIATNPF